MTGRRVPRRLRRESDGSLYDVEQRRRVELDELRDDVRAGQYFRAVRASSGEDCTQEVLAQVVVAALPAASPGGGVGQVGKALTGLIGGMVSGSVNLPVDEPRRPARRRSRRSADRRDWWEGD